MIVSADSNTSLDEVHLLKAGLLVLYAVQVGGLARRSFIGKVGLENSISGAPKLAAAICASQDMMQNGSELSQQDPSRTLNGGAGAISINKEADTQA